ncbi:MAG: hypothetical protein QXD20_09530 [Ignisphaera sp.]
MERKVLVSLLAGVIAGCGGGSGIGGAGAGSFYNLNVVLETAHIESKSVEVDQNGNITLPPDNIKGRVSLVYTGNSTNPLRAVVRNAELCILDQCYVLPIAGVLVPGGQPLQIDMNINSHKVGLPWIAVNPIEDRVINTGFVDISFTAASQSVSFNLPPKTPLRQYVYRVSGRVVEVYQGNTKLCDNQGLNTSCQISRAGDSVIVQFSGNVPPGLTLRYSEEEVVDINPTIDARQYGGQWNGTSNPTVIGTVRVKVRLEDGSSLTAIAPISFKIVP